MKKELIIFIMLVLSLQMVYGNYVRQFYHYDEDSKDVTNIRRIGWRCIPYDKTDCTEVDRNIPFTVDPTPVESGSTNYIEYEETAASQSDDPEYFIEYAYTEGYHARVWAGQQHSAYSGSPVVDPIGPYDVTMGKKDNCGAEFTPNIYSCAEQGIPLSILTDTNLNLDTASAFGPYDYYWPDELSDWDRVDTQMMVDIKKSGTGQPSVSGYPQYQTAEIYGGETHKFEFVWETTKDTPVGYYDIE